MHRILYIKPQRGIPDRGILYIVGIKIRIIFREIHHPYHILKTYLLESLIPRLDPLFNIRLPLLGHQRVHVKHDRFLHLDHFSPAMSGLIYRFHPPTFRVKRGFQPLPVILDLRNLHERDSQPGIGQAGTHGFFRQQHQHLIRRHGNFHVPGNHLKSPEQILVLDKSQLTRHHDIIIESVNVFQH